MIILKTILYILGIPVVIFFALAILLLIWPMCLFWWLGDIADANPIGGFVGIPANVLWFFFGLPYVLQLLG